MPPGKHTSPEWETVLDLSVKSTDGTEWTPQRGASSSLLRSPSFLLSVRCDTVGAPDAAASAEGNGRTALGPSPHKGLNE
eukprot:9034525-Pyramimonas_sp.AAC.1